MRLSFLVLVLLLFSCKKDRSCEECNTESGFKNATIVYTGPFESDGCDWLVQIEGDKFYHPDILGNEFKKNGLDVNICYELTSDEFRCGIAALSIPVIHVLKIKK